MRPNRRHSASVRRFALSALIAFPMTVLLVFLMTRLILPSERDRIVTRMIQNIEYRRADSPPIPTGIQVFELPPPFEREPPPIEQLLAAETLVRSANQSTPPEEVSEDEGRVHVIDWWAAARRVAEESDDKALKRWLLEQGYEPYVSIMQGELPITNSVRGTLSSTQEDITGYMNTYGDMEIKISNNCVIQTQVSARLDISDFASKLPMRVVCKSAPKQEFSFDRSDR